MKFHQLFILLLIFIISCGTRQKKIEKSVSINLVDSIQVYTDANDIEHELNPESIKLNSSNEIVIFNKDTYELIIFDKNKFGNNSQLKRKVQLSKGKGPGEFVWFSDFEFNNFDSKYYCCDSDGRKIVVLDSLFEFSQDISLPIKPSRIVISNNKLYLSNMFSAQEEGNVVVIDLNDQSFSYRIETVDLEGDYSSPFANFFHNMSIYLPITENEQIRCESRAFPDFKIKLFKNDSLLADVYPPGFKNVDMPEPRMYNLNGQRKFESLQAYSDIVYCPVNKWIIAETCSGYAPDFAKKYKSSIFIFDLDGNTICNYINENPRYENNKIL